VELNQSPDGADADPLTLPKCVECSHCGWPVYPRESKVATKKTFLRAGIVRGTKTEEDAKRKEEEKNKAAEGGEADDTESTDSRDTVERMADEIEDLKDANTELDNKVQELEVQNENLTKELAETKEALAAAEDKIEFMEEAEQRWRDKLSQARTEIGRLKQVLERASMVSADRETGLVKTLLELQALKEEFAAYKRRRNFMLRELEQRFEAKQTEDDKAIVLRLWRASIIRERYQRKLEDLEARRQREVFELSRQLKAEREHVLDLRAAKERLQNRLKQAGHRLLRRALGRDAYPSALDHAFRVFVATHPVNSLENALEYCQGELDKANAALDEMTQKAEALEEERDALLKERRTLSDDLEKVSGELAFLKEQIGGSLLEMEQRKRAHEEKERQHKLHVEELEQKIEQMDIAFADERESFETQIRMLESRLSLAESASGAKKDTGDDDNPSRVVPKGQGVLCVGCLKQLVHRGVKPLPPVGALSLDHAKLDAAKKKFFQKELSGALDPNDELHSHAFQTGKDPYGLARLSLHPPAAVSKPSSPTAASSPNLLLPSTGLPALKRGGFAGSATALRSSMREFRPRSFR